MIELGPRIATHGQDITALGSGLHAVIAAELANPGQPDALDRARALLLAHGVDALSPADAATAARRFRTCVLERFAPQRIHAEYPVVRAMANGMVVRGWVDVLVETESGWLIIDHKSSPRPRSEWEKQVSEYSGQLAAYREAVAASGRTVAGCWIHFPISGGLVEVIV